MDSSESSEEEAAGGQNEDEKLNLNLDSRNNDEPNNDG
jgi:hypothetical protein